MRLPAGEKNIRAYFDHLPLPEAVWQAVHRLTQHPILDQHIEDQHLLAMIKDTHTNAHWHVRSAS
eukprot:1069698-Pyramimonas_sp.AAC.1